MFEDYIKDGQATSVSSVPIRGLAGDPLAVLQNEGLKRRSTGQRLEFYSSSD